MSSIEERVVSMKLNNSQFESNAKRTLGTLGSLSKSLKLENAAKGLTNISSAAKGMNFQSLASSVDGLSRRFSAMSVIGVTALATIANKAVNAGLNLGKSLTFSPIKSGFDEYELKMSSIQTILSNTARYGTKLPEVTKNLDELNKYADKTIYNFGDMTKNIGLFTNAGLRVGEATQLIKGFSNEAAASGTSAQGAASAAYQLSQALSAGKITLMDWRSLQNVGMGNKNMQRGIIEIADAMGTLKTHGQSSSKIQKDFNASLKDGWLTAGVMSKYLKVMSQDNEKLNRAQLKNIGITGKQADAFIIQQKNAQEAATKVRTLTQLMGTIRESIGSSWTDTFDILLGNFNQATSLFTGINDSLGKTIGKMGDARNKLLRGWAQLGGRTILIEGLKNAFQALSIIIKAVKDAFNTVFPPATARQLLSMTKSFRDFTAGLKMGGENADRLKRTFAGVFSIFKIGFTIIKGVVTTLFSLFGIAQSGAGGFLALTASVGDFVVKIQEWLVSSGRIKAFFSTINTARAAILVPLIAAIGKIAQAFGALFRGDTTGFVNGIKSAFGGLGSLFDGIWKSATSQIQGFLANVRDATGIASAFLKTLGISALKPLQLGLAKLSENFGKLRDLVRNFGFDFFKKGASGASSTLGAMGVAADRVRQVLGMIKNAFGQVAEMTGPIGASIGTLFKTITDKITEFIKNLDMQDLIALVNTAFFIAMYKAIRSFMKNMDGMISSFKGIGDSIKEVMDVIKTSVTDTLSLMQKDVKADIILKIAISLGILAASLYILSTINPGKLAMAIGAVGILLISMTKAMSAMLGMLDTVEGQAPKKMGAILAVGGSILLLAAGILLLSVAVKNLSSLSWAEMAKGLIATGILLGALTLFTKFADTEKQSIGGAASLILLAGAIYLLSFSVSKLGEMDTGKLIQGAIALDVILVMLTSASATLQSVPAGAASIIAMALALAILTPAIIALGLVPLENLAKGVGTIAAALLLLAGTAVAMEFFGAAGVPAILAMAAALAILTPVIISLGLVPIPNLVKGLIAIAFALRILAIASSMMGSPASIAGSVGLIAMALALQMLVPVILVLGRTDLKTLAIGLGAMAVALGVFLLAGAAATTLGPGLLMLGGALALVGVGLGLAGAGFLAFATGFAALAAIGTAGFAVLTVGFMGLVNLIPLAAQQIGLGLRAVAVVISKSGPQFVAALTVLLLSLLTAIRQAGPPFFATMTVLVLGLIKAVEILVPRLAIAGTRMLMSFLTVIGNAIGPVSAKATAVMLAFFSAVSKNVGPIVAKATGMMFAFLGAIAKQAGPIVAKVVAMMSAFLSAIARQAGPIVAKVAAMMVAFLSAVARNATSIVAKATSMMVAFLGAVARNAILIAAKAASMMVAFLNAVSRNANSIVAKATSMMLSFLGSVSRNAGLIVSKASGMMIAFLNAVSRNANSIVAKVASMMISFLNAIGRNVGPVAAKATDLMIAFMNAVARNVPRLVDGGFKAVIALLNGIASAIRGNSGELNAAGRNIASAIIEGMVGGIGGGISAVTSAATNLAKSALSAAKGFLKINSPSKKFIEVGLSVGEGFAKGLDGNKAAIDKSMSSMRKLVQDAMKNASKDIATAQARLKTLNAARHKDASAIRAQTKALAQARSEYAKESSANNKLKTWYDEQKRLGSLANQYDVLTTRITNAKKALADVTKVRDDYSRTVKDNFDNLPDIADDTKLPDYIKSLQKQIADTQIFTAQLTQLKKLGLNNTMYETLLGKGTAAMPFVHQILDGGKTSVNELNTLGSALARSATSLGSTASKALYQAAVDSAAGLVKGLQNQQANIEKVMDQIALSMVKSLKKSLGIKSPSKEFMKVAGWSVDGLVKGLQQSSVASEKAAEQVGHGTIESLRKSLTGLADIVIENVDVDPTIRPVLDLSSVKKDAGQIGSLLTGKAISVGATFASAKTVSADYSANQASTEQTAGAGSDSLTFNQYNSSPKALSEATIYRNTKNQISSAKGALKI